MSNNIEVILVTCPDTDSASKLAYSVVDQKLAACVNIVPGISSIYHWDGKINKDSEVLLVLKTSSEKRNELEDSVMDLHPYDNPEFISLKTEHVADAYRTWVNSSLS